MATRLESWHPSRRLRPLALSLSLAASLAAAAATLEPGRTVPAGPADGPAIQAPSGPDTPVGVALPYAGTPVDVLTYHYDAARTGWNPAETALTVASVQSGKFSLLATLAVDGEVFAQPLLVNAVTLADGTVHDLVVIATGKNSVYAFDAHSNALLWHVNLGTPQASADVGCSDVTTTYGIGSTPVVLRGGNKPPRLYVVDAIEPTRNEFHSRLHQLSLADGHDLKTPVEIKPSAVLDDGNTISFDPHNQWVRAGLAANAGQLYLAVGSHCDHNPNNITGWLLRYDAVDLSLQSAFHTVDRKAGYELAAPWNSGFAPAVDDDGTVWFVTGNGDFKKGGKDWGESVLRLAPTGRKVADWFTPAAYDTLNGGDLDFGSGGVMLLPPAPGQLAPPLAVAMGKDGTLYLLNRDKLGHVQAGDAGALQATRVASSGRGVWGGPAYWLSPTGGIVYYQTSADVLKGYTVATGATPSLTQSMQGTTTSSNGGAMMVVTSSGSQAGTGVVWVVRRANPLVLEAYDAQRLGAPIWSGPAGNWSAGRPFVTPVAANGRVYVGGSGNVSVYGLTP